MIPIILSGHTKAIVKILYNREGDFLFSGGKDMSIIVWFINKCSKMGTIPHTGAVVDFDVDYMTQFLLSVAGDGTLRLVDIQTGKTVELIEEENITLRCSSCKLSWNGKIVLASRWSPRVELYDIGKMRKPIRVIESTKRVTCSVFGLCDESVILGDECGVVSLYDIRNEKIMKRLSTHEKMITDMKVHPRVPLVLSGSKDQTAKLFDFDLLELMTYSSDRPVNSVGISSLMPHVILAGGQEAKDVTTTVNGEFLSRFYHIGTEEELCNFGGHFGPINGVGFHPNGRSYCSAGQDGSVHVHYFDDYYYNTKYDDDSLFITS